MVKTVTCEHYIVLILCSDAVHKPFLSHKKYKNETKLLNNAFEAFTVYNRVPNSAVLIQLREKKKLTFFKYFGLEKIIGFKSLH